MATSRDAVPGDGETTDAPARRTRPVKAGAGATGAAATKAVRATRSTPAKASKTLRIRPDTEADLDVEDYDDEPAEEAAPAARRAAPRVTATAPSRASRPPAKATMRTEAPAEEEEEVVEPRPAADAARPVAPIGVPVAPPAKAVAPPLAPLETKKGRTSEEIVRDVINTFGTVFNYVAVVAAAILIIYVLLKAGGANDSNSIYTWFRNRSNNDIVFAFRHLFKENPVDGKNDVAANFLVAAVVYLAAGAIVKKICRRIAGH